MDFLEDIYNKVQRKKLVRELEKLDIFINSEDFNKENTSTVKDNIIEDSINYHLKAILKYKSIDDFSTEIFLCFNDIFNDSLITTKFFDKMLSLKMYDSLKKCLCSKETLRSITLKHILKSKEYNFPIREIKDILGDNIRLIITLIENKTLKEDYYEMLLFDPEFRLSISKEWNADCFLNASKVMPMAMHSIYKIYGLGMLEKEKMNSDRITHELLHVNEEGVLENYDSFIRLFDVLLEHLCSEDIEDHNKAIVDLDYFVNSIKNNLFYEDVLVYDKTTIDNEKMYKVINFIDLMNELQLLTDKYNEYADDSNSKKLDQYFRIFQNYKKFISLSYQRQNLTNTLKNMSIKIQEIGVGKVLKLEIPLNNPNNFVKDEEWKGINN